MFRIEDDNFFLVEVLINELVVPLASLGDKLGLIRARNLSRNLHPPRRNGPGLRSGVQRDAAGDTGQGESEKQP